MPIVFQEIRCNYYSQQSKNSYTVTCDTKHFNKGASINIEKLFGSRWKLFQ